MNLLVINRHLSGFLEFIKFLFTQFIYLFLKEQRQKYNIRFKIKRKFAISLF